MRSLARGTESASIIRKLAFEIGCQESYTRDRRRRWCLHDTSSLRCFALMEGTKNDPSPESILRRYGT